MLLREMFMSRGSSSSPSKSVRIDPDALEWRQVGEADGDPASRLKATLIIGATQHHVDAIAVRHVTRGGATMQLGATDETDNVLGVLYGLVAADGPFDTVAIAGRDYVLFMTPASL
jgi:hypothetical protein